MPPAASVLCPSRATGMYEWTSILSKDWFLVSAGEVLEQAFGELF